MDESTAFVYEIQIGDKRHCIFEAADEFVIDDHGGQPVRSTLNVVMVDVSASMSGYWKGIKNAWNDHLANVLIGRTKIFVFGSRVRFRREGVNLEQSDFLSEDTNLTEAIEVINQEIQRSSDQYIRIILITDGHHNSTKVKPDVEIKKLSIPYGKTIEVFLLGLGTSFPVEYSIEIRSLLHNGSSNVPSLFWVKGNKRDRNGEYDEITEQIMSIAEFVGKGTVQIKCSIPGMLAPGFQPVEVIHARDFLYFERTPEEILKHLTLSTEDGVPVEMQIVTRAMDIRTLLERVFPQWNSIIIQEHRKNGTVSEESFNVMQSIFDTFYKKIDDEMQVDGTSKSIKQRLGRKDMKFMEVEFATLMNQSKTIIGLEGKYSSEMDLAEKILKTTVKSKHDMKNLKMKGHGIEEYDRDIKEFQEAFDKNKDKILALPEPEPEDCCRVTLMSTLKDLKDPGFPELLTEDKFTFLKTFTITGMPIYAPVKSSSQINPWSLVIRNILNSPYTIVSINALELSADAGNLDSSSHDKEIYLQQGDENSKFNAVIPVFSPEVAKALKPLVITNIFAMLCSFSILKNAHIIDYSCHIAALACAWVKLISDFPRSDRPEFVVNRIKHITATAIIYMGRPSIRKHVQTLIAEPTEAIMTESVKTFENKTLKSETLIKPMFFLYLNRKEIKDDIQKLLSIVSLIIMEFIGRCLAANSNQESTIDCIYCTYFVPELSSKEKRQKLVDDYKQGISTTVLESFRQQYGEPIQKYFRLQELQVDLKKFLQQQMFKRENKEFDYKVNMEMVKKLRNTSAAGNVTLKQLNAYVTELGIPEDQKQSLFSEEKIFTYVVHGLENRNSRDRLSKPIPTFDEALKRVKEQVAKETNKGITSDFTKLVADIVESDWLNKFRAVHHNDLVSPMTREEIIADATQRGVAVTEGNFDKVFRHNRKSLLLRNACMIKRCPFYLKPNRSFNQHLELERQGQPLHQLHKISSEVAFKGGTAEDVIRTVLEEGYVTMNGLKKPSIPTPEALNKMKPFIDRTIEQYKKLYAVRDDEAME